MNPDPDRLLTKLQSRLTIRQAQQTITTEKEAMKIYCFTPAEREIIKANKGSMTKVIEARKASAEARKTRSEAPTSAPSVAAKKPTPTSNATRPAPAASRSVTASPKDNGLAISRAEFDALPPSDKMEFKRLGGQVAPASSAPEATPKAATPAKPLTGLQRAISAHRGEVSAPDVPKPLTGLAAATAAHKAQAAARKQ